MQSWHLKFNFAPKPGVRSLVNKYFIIINETYLFQAKILKPNPPTPQKNPQFLSIITPPNPA